MYPTGLAWRSHLMCTRTCRALHFSRSRDQVGVYPTGLAWRSHLMCTRTCRALHFSRSRDQVGVYLTSVAFSPDVYQDMQGVTFQQVTRQDVLKGKDGQTEMGVSDLCQHRHQGVQRVQAQHLQPQQYRTDV